MGDRIGWGRRRRCRSRSSQHQLVYAVCKLWVSPLWYSCCRIVLRGYQVGICSLPGNRLGGARRSLPADIETLKVGGSPRRVRAVHEYRTRLVRDRRNSLSCVCLFPSHRSRVHTLLSDYEEHGLVPHHHPLSDNEIPSKQQCVDLLRDLWGAIQKRRRAVVQYVSWIVVTNGRHSLYSCINGNGRACLGKWYLSPLHLIC